MTGINRFSIQKWIVGAGFFAFRGVTVEMGEVGAKHGSGNQTFASILAPDAVGGTVKSGTVALPVRICQRELLCAGLG